MKWIYGIILTASLIAGIGIQPVSAAGTAVRCTVSVSAVRFGQYNPFATTDTRANGEIAYACTAPTPIEVEIDHGTHGSFAARRLMHGNIGLEYNLFLDAGATAVWGDGTGGSQVYRDPAPSANRHVIVPIFGRIPAQQHEARTGAYVDDLVVSVSF